MIISCFLQLIINKIIVLNIENKIIYGINSDRFGGLCKSKVSNCITIRLL